jgi:type VI secretion system secreted protein VgrG
MATYTQTNRPLRVTSALGEDVLLLDSFAGAERISEPYLLTVELLSTQPDLDAAAVLRKPMCIEAELPGGGTRYLHGLVRRFVQLEKKEELTAYRAEVVPWLWFLTLSQDCKIFQEKTVLEIIEDVFKDQGYSDFEIKATRSYAAREYCVQYRETHLAFVSRLMEEEGLYYYFEHTAEAHTLVITDSNSALPSCPGAAQARMARQSMHDEDVVLGLWREHTVHTGTMALTDYDYLQPSVNLEASTEGDGEEEHFDYPGKYVTRDEGDRYTRLQIEAVEALHQTVRGTSTCRGFRSGGRFTLRDHYRRDTNQEYLLVEVKHHGSAGDYRSWDGGTTEYRNEFLAIPFAIVYRPLRKTKRPLVQGSQTALVVGPAGEEIYVDRYSRIKVQFYWDRYGQKNENSSCWLRVATPWAGKNWGMITIPRIGQEVVVHFIEGDPDRPLVVASVYNAAQMPPYELPANQTQSGIKSRSSKGGSGANFNEIRFEDLKDGELFYMHAEKDKQVIVENDRDEDVGRDETINIGRDRTETVGQDESITIGRDRTEDVGQDETIGIGRNRSENVGQDETIGIGRDRSESVGRRETITIGDTRMVKVGKDDTLKVGKKLLVEAGDEIVLKTGQSTITMKKDGTITIKGKDITVQGSGKINVKANGDVTIKGSKVKEN